jgi:hypothetical protein
MSTINQYFMYGISVSYDWYKEWEAGTGRKFPVGNYGRVFCLFDSRDGKYIIIGKILEETNEDNPYLGEKKPLVVPTLEEVDEVIIQNSVWNEFGLKGKFYYYFITKCL